jgi:hypothetical protein
MVISLSGELTCRNIVNVCTSYVLKWLSGEKRKVTGVLGWCIDDVVSLYR